MACRSLTSLLTLALAWFTRRYSAALVFPAFILVSSIAVNLVVREICPGNAACHPDRWFFQPFDRRGCRTYRRRRSVRPARPTCPIQKSEQRHRNSSH